jgi:mannan endo-1,4-beta-mannosidase
MPASRDDCRRRQLRRAVALLAALTAVSMVCSCGTSRTVTPPLYWGAYFGDHLTGTQPPWDMSAVSRLEALTGKRPSLVHFASPFASCRSSGCSFYAFPAAAMETVRRYGAIPFFSWGSQSTPSSLDEPDFQLADIITGTYDEYIRTFAEAARRWGHPFFLRFNHEMNGRWFPWAEGVNGNRRGEYVQAWRHVHDIFRRVGATNVTWTWCPNVDVAGSLGSLRPLYPGDRYVDWTCLDGYNAGTDPRRPDVWRTFDEIFGSTYQEVVQRVAPDKPMVIGEVASSELGGSKAAWIEDMLSSIPRRYPQIRGIVWFERVEDGVNWPIETSRSSLSAFARGIQGPAYVSNDYSDLSGGSIRPPSTRGAGVSHRAAAQPDVRGLSGSG